MNNENYDNLDHIIESYINTINSIMDGVIEHPKFLKDQT